MKHVFVSYKTEDRERVRALVEGLRRSGVPTWWDQDIPTGAPWEASITQALHDAECVLVCWTKLSTNPKSGAKVQVEAREALDNEKLVQVLLDEADPPLFFRQFQAANLRSWDGALQHAEFQSVAQAVRDILDGKTPAKFAHVGKNRRMGRWLVAIAGLAVCVAAAPTLMNLANGAITSARNMYAANTRQDIRLLRVGSPFDEGKPPLAPPDLEGVFAADTIAPLTVDSTTASALLDTINAARESGIEPELFAFDNYGIFEVSEGVPYRSTTIREAFPHAHFIKIVGPMAERIQSRGWVFLNASARNAQNVIALALAQRTCRAGGPVTESAVTRSIVPVLAARIEGQTRLDLCRVVQHGDLVLVEADAIVRAPEEIGLVSQLAILRLDGATSEVLSVTDDSVSTCIFGADADDEDCARTFDRVAGAAPVPESLTTDQHATPAPAPVVQLTSPVEMVNRRGAGNDITWADFVWRTQNPSELAYQLVIFDMGGLDRVFAMRPAEQASIPSGLLMGGGERSRWRVISVTNSGEVLTTAWQPYLRVDLYPNGERVVFEER